MLQTLEDSRSWGTSDSSCSPVIISEIVGCRCPQWAPPRAVPTDQFCHNVKIAPPQQLSCLAFPFCEALWGHGTRTHERKQHGRRYNAPSNENNTGGDTTHAVVSLSGQRGRAAELRSGGARARAGQRRRAVQRRCAVYGCFTIGLHYAKVRTQSKAERKTSPSPSSRGAL